MEASREGVLEHTGVLGVVMDFLPLAERFAAGMASRCFLAASRALEIVDVSFSGSLHSLNVMDRQFGIAGVVDPKEYSALLGSPLAQMAFRVMQSHEGHFAIGRIHLPSANLARQRLMRHTRTPHAHTNPSSSGCIELPIDWHFVVRVYAVSSLEEAAGLEALMLRTGSGEGCHCTHVLPHTSCACDSAIAEDNQRNLLCAAAATELATFNTFTLRGVATALALTAGCNLKVFAATDCYIDSSFLHKLADALTHGSGSTNCMLRRLHVGCMLPHRVNAWDSTFSSALASRFALLEDLDISNCSISPACLLSIMTHLRFLKRLIADGPKEGPWVTVAAASHRHGGSVAPTFIATGTAGVSEARSRSDEADEICRDATIRGFESLLSPPQLSEYARLIPEVPSCKSMMGWLSAGNALVEVSICEAGAGALHILLSALVTVCRQLQTLAIGYHPHTQFACDSRTKASVYPLSSHTGDRHTYVGAGLGTESSHLAALSTNAHARLDICPIVAGFMGRGTVPLFAAAEQALDVSRADQSRSTEEWAAYIAQAHYFPAFNALLQSIERRYSSARAACGLFARDTGMPDRRLLAPSLSGDGDVPVEAQLHAATALVCMSPATQLWHTALYDVAAAPCASRLTHLSIHGHIPVNDTVLTTLVSRCPRLLQLRVEGLTEEDTYYTRHLHLGLVTHRPNPDTDSVSEHCATSTQECLNLRM